MTERHSRSLIETTDRNCCVYRSRDKGEFDEQNVARKTEGHVMYPTILNTVQMIPLTSGGEPFVQVYH